jgi:hypothetical protein
MEMLAGVVPLAAVKVPIKPLVWAASVPFNCRMPMGDGETPARGRRVVGTLTVAVEEVALGTQFPFR